NSNGGCSCDDVLWWLLCLMVLPLLQLAASRQTCQGCEGSGFSEKQEGPGAGREGSLDKPGVKQHLEWRIEREREMSHDAMGHCLPRKNGFHLQEPDPAAAPRACPGPQLKPLLSPFRWP
ncbi:hypothetical protein Vafri_7953, partial [Volvox africanus]